MSQFLNKILSASIGLKLSISFTFVVLATSIPLSLLMLKYVESQIKEHIINTVKSVIYSKSVELRNALLTDDYWMVYKQVDALSKLMGVRDIAVVDPEGRVIAHSDPLLYPIGSYLDRGKGEQVIPIESYQQVIAFVVFHIDYKAIESLLIPLKRISTLLTLGMLLLGVLMGFFVSFRISRRLRKILDMVDKFKTGKIERVEFLEKDEISAFGNYMYSTLLSLDTLIKNMQSAKAFYQSLTDSIDDMILILDTDGKIHFANRKVLELGFGYENLIGRSFLVLIVGSENRKRIRQKLKLREKTVEKVEIRKRSGKIYALMSLVPFEDSLIVSIKDITPIKQMEDRIRKLEAFYVLGELSAGLAHELKNALLPIKLLSDVENWDEEDIKVIKHAIDRINNTITSVLSLAGTTTVESRTLNAKDFVEDTVKAFEPLIKEKRVNLHIQVEDFTFVSDMNALRVILNNLLKNALDAVKYGGTVRVKLEKADNKVILSVEDDGPGIPTKYMDKVFDPFFTTKENGTGLGLSLVLKYTYKLGGFVYVQSEEGKGTKFVVEVPLKDE